MTVARGPRLFGRLVRRLGPFLRDRLDLPRSTAWCRQGLEAREAQFLAAIDHGVYRRPGSVYRRLVDHAGVSLGDVRETVRAAGVEATLERLFDAGVYVSLDEFKGRGDIRRGRLVVPARSHDFDNPLAARDFDSRTGGSRSAGDRLFVDLQMLAHDAAYVRQQLAMFDLEGRPTIVWCAAPPFLSGIAEILRLAKLGLVPRRWFAQSVAETWGRAWAHAVLTRTVLGACRAAGLAVPSPERTPLGKARVVAEVLARARRAGERPVLRANASSAVRVCAAAIRDGLDISGTVLRVSAEPFTPAKAEIVRQAGCTAAPWYAMSEVGIVGLPCGAPAAVDDVHFMADKLAMIRREWALRGGHRVTVNVYTTLSPSTPKLMLNVVTDDYAVSEERRCGCPLGRLGYTTHLHTIRSHEKLTSEGLTFVGHDLLRLVEEVLPARFGGGPTDYQLVEEERGGLPKVDLLVSPRLGPLDERAVLATALGFLDRAGGGRAPLGDRWRQGETMAVRRAEPRATAASKILALHAAGPTGPG